MTRKPKTSPDRRMPKIPAHPLPTEGGTYLVVDGALRVDPQPAPPTPDPEA